VFDPVQLHHFDQHDRHRIWVSPILDLLAGGMSSDEILREYPGLGETDVRACIACGSEKTRER
jgi:uncharacterized protein (DUF433 family)